MKIIIYLSENVRLVMAKKNPLIQLAGVPVSGAEIKACFPGLASPEKKFRRWKKVENLSA